MFLCPLCLLVACLGISHGIAQAVDPLKETVRTDLFGDPLPNGARARLGCSQLRHAGLRAFVFLDDGRTLLSAGTDFVMRFWDVATGRQVRAVRLHGEVGPESWPRLSPNGRIVAANDPAKKRIVVWEVTSGKKLKELPGGGNQWISLKFSPNSKSLAVVWAALEASVFDVDTWNEQQIRGPNISLGSHFGDHHASFSPDSRLFVFRYEHGTDVSIHEVSTGRRLHLFSGEAAGSAFSADCRRVAIFSKKNQHAKKPPTVRVYDLFTGKETARFVLEFEEFTPGMAFSPDGLHLAIAGHSIRLIDLSTGKEKTKFAIGETRPWNPLAYSPDGKTLAWGAKEDIVLSDSASGRIRHRLAGKDVLAFSPDGKILATKADTQIRLWDVATGKDLNRQAESMGHEPTVAHSPDGRWIASTQPDCQAIVLWETDTGRPVRRIPFKGDPYTSRSLVFSVDGKTLIGATAGALVFWDLIAGNDAGHVELRVLERSISFFGKVHVSPNGMQVASLGLCKDNTKRANSPYRTDLALWDWSTGKLLRQYPVSREPKRTSVWSINGQTVVVALKDGLTVLKVSSGQIRFRIPAAPGDGPGKLPPDFKIVGAVADERREPGHGPFALSPDGRFLASGWLGGAPGKAEVIGIWEVATGSPVATLPIARATNLGWSPDNDRLVITSDGFLQVWDVALREEQRRWPLSVSLSYAHGNTSVSPIFVLPDARRALLAMADGTGLVWDLGPAARRPAQKPNAEAIASWWEELAGADAGRAYNAVRRLSAVPDAALSVLRTKLKPAPEVDAKTIRRLLAELDSDVFEARQNAFEQLDDLGELAAAMVRQTLENNPSQEARRSLEALIKRPCLVRTPETRRRVRAVEVLERIASPEARRILSDLAGGAAHAPETQEAKAAIERLAPRSPST
jgi:WD40 repeat protein